MSAFDTVITPTAITPGDASEAILFTASADTAVLVDVANEGIAAIAIRVGIQPSGGSTHWKLFDVAIAPSDALASLGPFFLQNGDTVQIRTDTASDAVFSLTGLVSTA